MAETPTPNSSDLDLTESAVTEAGTRAAEDAPSGPSGGSRTNRGARDGVALGRGETVGRYLIVERLGAGGMGVVYAAYDPELDRKVALKLVRSAEGATEGSKGQARLLREAQAMAKLSHPNVAAVFDVGTHGQEVFVAMEFIEGETFKARMKSGDWSAHFDELLDAGRGLAAAHAAGLIHRDFKPDNVMVGGDGRPRVLDFGLVRGRNTPSAEVDATFDEARDEAGDEARELGLDGQARSQSRSRSLDQSLTAVGAVLGTPAYMAPEQHSGLEATALADQFAFCVVAWELVFGQRPFQGNTVAALAYEVMKGKPQKPATPGRGPAVPAHLERALRRGLSVDPQDRFASMEALLVELSRQPGRTARRALLGLGAVGGALAIGLTIGQSREEDEAAADPCAELAAQVDSVWNPARRDAVEARLADAGVDEGGRQRVAAQLDTWAERWARARVDSCEASVVRKEYSAELLDRQVFCLDHQRGQVDALITRWSDPELPAETVAEAESHLSKLDPSADLERCADLESLGSRVPQPADADAREKIAEIEGELEALQALSLTGAGAPAAEKASALIESARAIGWAPLVAELQLERGTALQRAGDSKAAREALEAGFFAAIEGGDEGLAQDLASSLAYATGYALNDVEGGTRWAAIARAYLARHPSPYREALLEQSVGAMLVAAGRNDEGIVAHTRSIELFERVEPPKPTHLAEELNNLGAAHFQKAEYDKALPLHERALGIFVEAYGESHPDVSITYSQLGNAQGGKGEHAAALASFEKAYAIADATVGARTRTGAIALDNQARMLRKLDRLDEAIAKHREALGIWRELLGEDHADVGISLLNMGYAEVAAEDFTGARKSFGDALGTFERSVGDAHPFIMYACNSVATVELELGNAAGALPCLDRVLGMDDSQVDPTLTAETRFLKARAYWALGQKSAARGLARAAAEQYRKGNPETWKAEIEQIESWLSEH